MRPPREGRGGRAAPPGAPNGPRNRAGNGKQDGAGDSADRPGLEARRVAARLLAAVVETKTSLDAMLDASHGHPHLRRLPPRDQALVRAILLAALRHRGTIEAELAARLERPLPANATALRHLLHVGAAQILFLDVPDSAAVDLAVAAAQGDPRARRFAGLVNAVLRRLAREHDAGTGPTADKNVSRETAMANCPGWLAARLVAQYGAARAAAIAAAHLELAPIDLTVKQDTEDWARRLGGRPIGSRTVRLDAPGGAVSELDGFAQGAWWVQDAAASLPARLFGDIAGKRAIDLCAAPGGKTAQLCLAGATVTALDLSASRMKRLAANLGRLGLTAETRVANLMEFEPDEPFDAVLLDAPCSSTGTIRRHPDIPYTKDAAEIDKLAALQAKLLARAADLVAPGGLLVFSNCSLDRTEGEDVVAAFLAARSDFERRPVTSDDLPDFAFAISAEGDLRTTPEMMRATRDGEKGGLDGFYAARLRRRPA